MDGMMFRIGLVLLLAVGAATADEPPDPALQARRTPVVDVFEDARDSVVNISSTHVIEVRSPFGFDRFFDFRGTDPFAPRRRQIERTSVGSGFVLHEDGYLVTNAHVVARTAERRAIFADGSEFDAEVVALDEPHDLAILKIDPGGRDLEPIRLGTSADLMVGETVIAIGNPLGYQHTVTAGVVSAVDRELPVTSETSLRGLIQTDASINPGNSGGPLLNILGELVGINTAIRADAQNIGFAIPVDHLRDLLPGMLDVERRYGIVTGLSAADAGGERTGAVVTGVDPEGPAAVAGLTPGSTIEAVAGRPVGRLIDYLIALIGRSPGEVVELTVRSADGRSEDISLRLGERPRPDGAALLLEKLGLEAEAINPRAAAQRGLAGLRGLVVSGVQLEGPADRAGIEPGDVLLQIGRHQPTTLDEVGELLETVTPGQSVDVAILRVSGRVLYRATARLRAR